MRIDSLGEFGLIDRLVSLLGSRDDVELGPGDDTAVVRAGRGMLLLLTADTLVERVHFVREQVPAPDLGWKSLAVSLSDIAAMGGTARWAAVNVRVGADLDVEWCTELSKGIAECADKYDVSVVGGNVARSPAGDVSLDSFVVGTVEEGRYVPRSGAQPGDVVVVTGSTGRAASGHGCLDRGLAGEPFAESLVSAFCRPTPRLDAGRLAAGEPSVTAMIDISDGLLADLGHICESSGVAAEIDVSKVPVAEDLAAYGKATGADPLKLALTGGEDYELVITCRPETGEEFADRVEGTVIGSIRAGEGVTVVDGDGLPVGMDTTGWDHLKGQ